MVIETMFHEYCDGCPYRELKASRHLKIKDIEAHYGIEHVVVPSKNDEVLMTCEHFSSCKYAEAKTLLMINNKVPLNYEEITGYKYAWLETRNELGVCDVMPVKILQTSSNDFIKVLYPGNEIVQFYDADKYGKTWRCWRERPSESETASAEWIEYT